MPRLPTVLIGSPRGGVDIETVAKENPEDIFTQPVPLAKGLFSLLCTQSSGSLA